MVTYVPNILSFGLCTEADPPLRSARHHRNSYVPSRRSEWQCQSYLRLLAQNQAHQDSLTSRIPIELRESTKTAPLHFPNGLNFVLTLFALLSLQTGNPTNSYIKYVSSSVHGTFYGYKKSDFLTRATLLPLFRKDGLSPHLVRFGSLSASFHLDQS